MSGQIIDFTDEGLGERAGSLPTHMTGKFDFIETDKRILDQRLRRHQISQQEYQKILKNVPDEKDASEEVKVHLEHISLVADKK